MVKTLINDQRYQGDPVDRREVHNRLAVEYTEGDFCSRHLNLEKDNAQSDLYSGKVPRRLGQFPERGCETDTEAPHRNLGRLLSFATAPWQG